MREQKVPDVESARASRTCVKVERYFFPARAFSSLPGGTKAVTVSQEDRIPLCPCCKLPFLYSRQGNPGITKCSYCHSVFPSSCIHEYLPEYLPRSPIGDEKLTLFEGMYQNMKRERTANTRTEENVEPNKS